MAETYKRAVFVEPRTIRFDELSIPEPGPSQALVKVRACALCTWLAARSLHKPGWATAW